MCDMPAFANATDGLAYSDLQDLVVPYFVVQYPMDSTLRDSESSLPSQLLNPSTFHPPDKEG